MNYTPVWSFEWVDTDTRLATVAAELEREPLLAIDTETAGWETNNERLCLIQIGIPSHEKVIVVDATKISDFNVLRPVLSGKTPQLIVHNAPFEKKQFERYGIRMDGVIDTLEMSRKLRPDLPNHTLKTCCKLLLKVEIDKAEQTSDWSIRPLSEKQLSYARSDAELAYALYSLLKAIEDRLSVDTKLSVSELMRLLLDNARSKFELTKEIAAELSFLSIQEEALREAIRSKLVAGEPSYEGQYGSCKISKVRRFEIIPAKLREIMPDLAPQVIREEVNKGRLATLMKEHGVPEEKMEEVQQLVGYNDRLYLSLADYI